VSLAAHIQRPRADALGPRAVAEINPWTIGTIGLAAFALALRLAAADQQSAYMDEGTNVLTGRLLIEQHAVYAEILNWAYGSYLWPVIAGIADQWGGLRLVRGVTAACGVVMVLATAGAAYRLAPAAVSESRRRAVALLAGGVMAVAPPAIGVSRFGSYDALAGAAFMLAVTLTVPAGKTSHPVRLLSAAALLFVAFLAKYLVAIYFPFICIYLVAAAFVYSSPDRFRRAAHHVAWFVLPLSAACALYLVVFLGPLLNLLTSSMHYSDLKSPDPWREYVWTQPAVALLIALAVVGWRRAPLGTRVVAAGGTAIIMVFQLGARPDFDFWKHAIYVIYFLAPLAALTWLAIPQHTGTWRVLGLASAALAALWSWSPAIHATNAVVHFYPNLNPSIASINGLIAGSALVLTDDTALRYYLYPDMDTDRVVGPFFFTYRSQDGLEAYRNAISDRFFDAIVLDGGVTPQGAAFRQQLGQTIQDFYQKVYSEPDGGGFTIEVFKPVRPQGARSTDAAELSWPVAYTFDTGSEGWGAHPDGANWQPGLHIANTHERPWEGHASLQVTPTPEASTLSLRTTGGHVTRVRARIFLTAAETSTMPIRVGFMGFDDAWKWHDDGFRWVVAPGSWTTITWDLAAPGNYEELGLKFPTAVSRAYVGSFEIDP
jgi:hypothetical protein